MARPATIRFGTDLGADLYRPVGTPLSAVVIVHGGGAEGKDHPIYRFLGRRLCRAGYGVLVPNLGGFGDSPPRSPLLFDPFCALEDLRGAIEAMQRHLAVSEGEIALVGHSGGANVVASLVAEEGQRYQSAILLSPGEFTGKAESERDVAGWLSYMARQRVSEDYVRSTLRKLLVPVEALPDDLVLVVFGGEERRLLEAWAGPLSCMRRRRIAFIVIEGAGHFYGFREFEHRSMLGWARMIVRGPHRRLLDAVRNHLTRTRCARPAGATREDDISDLGARGEAPIGKILGMANRSANRERQ